MASTSKTTTTKADAPAALHAVEIDFGDALERLAVDHHHRADLGLAMVDALDRVAAAHAGRLSGEGAAFVAAAARRAAREYAAMTGRPA